MKRITKRQKGNCSHLEDENTEGDVSVNPDGGLLGRVEAGQAERRDEQHGQRHGRTNRKDDTLSPGIEVVAAVCDALLNDGENSA